MKKTHVFLFCIFLLCAAMMLSAHSLAASNTSEYTITYHLDDGTNALKNPDVYTSEDTIILQAATKRGYDFVGWFLDSEKTVEISEISNLTGDLNIYAKFTPKHYTATFRDAVVLTVQVEGKESKQYYLPYGSTLDPYSKEFMSDFIPESQNSVYAKVDPCFSGWYVVNGSGRKTKLDSTLTMESDITLWCNFKLTNRGDAPADATILPCTKITGDKLGHMTYVRVPTLSNGELQIEFYVKRTKDDPSGNYSMRIYNCTQGGEFVASAEVRNLNANSSATRYVDVYANPGDILEIYM